MTEKQFIKFILINGLKVSKWTFIRFYWNICLLTFSLIELKYVLNIQNMMKNV